MSSNRENKDVIDLTMSLFDSGPVCIIRWQGMPDENSNVHPVLYVTKNAEEILGHPREDLMSQSIQYAELIHPGDLDRVLEKLHEHAEKSEKSAFTDQYRIQTKSGETVWVSDHTQTILNEDGTVKELVGYISNITELVDQRRAVEKLEIARTAAEEADKTKSQFLANMSHEIRTPMNGIMGMAELLAESNLSPKQKTFADIIVNSGESLLTIINDILDFSKINADEMELYPEPFDLRNAIEDAAILVSSKIEDKNIELVVRVDPAIPSMLIGDSGHIRQIAINLLSNAIKFTEEGHVLVDISREINKNSNSSVANLTFKIEDTGIGIPEEKQKTIFDKFTQVDNSATRPHEGTGLGLSISKSLVELMGGRIWLESTVGEGSTFSFEVELPIHELEEKATITPIPIDVSGSKILVIDDNRVNRHILEEQLLSWGFEVILASSGPDGWKILYSAFKDNEPIDAVVLDYHMPEMNGHSVAKMIRNDANISTTPIIMLTSVDQTNSINQFAELQLQGHLLKPAKSSLLRQLIVESLQANSVDLGSPLNDLLHEKNTKYFGATIVNQKPVPTEPTLDILIAEDNEVNAIVYTQILNDTDYKYLIVPNGAEAINSFKKMSPTIIIMDISMPVLCGIEATKQIREFEADSNKRTPIIGVTAHAMAGDMERCFDVGMDDYMPKPISPKRILEKIDSWISKDSRKLA